MQNKILVFNPQKCTGCRACEIGCSLEHTDTCNPSRSRVRVIKIEKKGIDIPVRCLQCERKACVAACPVGALKTDPKLGFVDINYNRCLGCRICLVVCPFGGPTIDPKDNKIIICDLCGGDPACVRLCTTKAIEYVTADIYGLSRKRESMKQFVKATAFLAERGE